MSDERDSQIIEFPDKESSSIPEFPKISYDERLRLAQERWKQSNGAISIARAANMYGVKPSTLRDRINGAISKTEASQNMQCLSPGEEEALAGWILLLASWGWPVKIEQLRGMACELLQAQDNTKELGIHWTDKFLNRHPALKSKFVTGLEKDRVAAEDPAIVKDWFELVEYHIKENAVEMEDIHNMDEKGIMMGAAEKVKVIISKHEKRQYMTTSGSREWVSLIECISAAGKALDPWIIFKGKMHKAAWMKTLQSGHIALSDTGWTDNELGLAWLKNCFDPGTLRYDNSGKQRPRILILDGHASHISTEAIQFCLQAKIIALCLSRHSTHLLQPLDVGVFSSYAHYYKKALSNRCRFAAHYSVDKIDFLEILQETRAQALTEEIILKAWKKSGLFPWNSEVVLQQLLSRQRPSTPVISQTPSLTYTASNGEAFQAALTPKNVMEVENLVKKILEGEVDPAIVLQIKKLSKGAVKAIANTTIQSSTNKELLLQLKRQKQKATRTDERLVGYGRYLGPEVLAERAAKMADKQFQAVWKDFLKLNPVLLTASVKKSVKTKLSNNKREQAFTAAVKSFLKLDPEIFTINISTTWPSSLSIASQKTRSGRIVKTRTFLGDDEM